MHRFMILVHTRARAAGAPARSAERRLRGLACLLLVGFAAGFPHTPGWAAWAGQDGAKAQAHNLTNISATAPAAAVLPARPPAGFDPSAPVTRIAFGSCVKHDRPQHVWDAVRRERPQVFVFLGDTVYADTEDMAELRGHYEALAAVPAFAALREEALVFGTWDDHDYGVNDGGAEFPARRESQRELLSFYDAPPDDPRRSRDGVYTSVTLGPEGRRVQFILLDTRFFRTPLTRRANPREDWIDGYPGPYIPAADRDATLLGEAQWTWLGEVLREPAEVRILCSSIQVVSEDHGFEKWANMPSERARLLRTIADAGAEGLIVLSGDRHASELSLLDPARAEPGSIAEIGYPLYDLTSSALTQSSGVFWQEINRHRVGSLLRENNFGLVEIDWEAPNGPVITLALHLDDGRRVLRHRVPLTELSSGGGGATRSPHGPARAGTTPEQAPAR